MAPVEAGERRAQDTYRTLLGSAQGCRCLVERAKQDGVCARKRKMALGGTRKRTGPRGLHFTGRKQSDLQLGRLKKIPISDEGAQMTKTTGMVLDRNMYTDGGYLVKNPLWHADE